MSDKQMDTTLYRLRNKKTGLYYSPRSTGRGWNNDGKFLTRRQLGQIPLKTRQQAIIETWDACLTEEQDCALSK